jgi:hypothetical protein
LKEVAKNLGRTEKPVFNPAGPASPGDASLSFVLEEGLQVWIAFASPQKLFFRVGLKEYAVDGYNQWFDDTTLSPKQVASEINRGIELSKQRLQAAVQAS